MEEDILRMIINAEEKYQSAVRNALETADKYTEDRQKEQIAAREALTRDWHLFEIAETENLERLIHEEERKIDAETAQLKVTFKTHQVSKVDIISERLKEEVLAFYGNR